MDSQRVVDTPDTDLPELALLGQRPFTVMISAAGGGMTKFGETAINRWRADATRDSYGQWCYVREVSSGRIWSATHQPVCAEADSYEVTMDLDRVAFQRRDGEIETRTEIVVDHDSAAEFRRVTVTNLSGRDAEIELTSYQEITLATLLADRGHRAFSNLFVQTEWIPSATSVLAMRRPRSALDSPSWCGHTIASAVGDDSSVSCETDRAKFIGRGRSSRNPVAMGKAGDLAGNTGAVLDPVIALRKTLGVPAGGSARVVFTTFAAKDRDDALAKADLYSRLTETEKLFRKEEDSERKLLETLEITPFEARFSQGWAAALVYQRGGLRDEREPVPGDRSQLVSIGITAEWPVAYAHIVADPAGDFDLPLKTYLYWRAKGITCDLVLFCDDDNAVVRTRDRVSEVLYKLGITGTLDRPKGIHIMSVDAIDRGTYDLLKSVALSLNSARMHRVPARE